MRGKYRHLIAQEHTNTGTQERPLKFMKKILSIAYYTYLENIRNKIFYVIILFGIVLVATALLLSALGGEQSRRVLLDVGLGAIEFLALITAGFAAVTLALEEMESKTIYLILIRPVPRGVYLVGRYLGLLGAVYSGMLIMAALHVGIMFFQGWIFEPRYILALLFSAEKITVIGALALFFSLFSTSAVSSVSFTVFFWILGHFSEEIRFLGEKAHGIIAKMTALSVYYLLPNMQYFNIRDFWGLPSISNAWVVSAALYGFFYSAACLASALWLFHRREF